MLVCRHTGGSRRGLTHRKRPRGCPGVYLGGLFESLDVLLSSGGLDPPDTHVLKSRWREVECGQDVVEVKWRETALVEVSTTKLAVAGVVSTVKIEEEKEKKQMRRVENREGE